jgi:hypothetical protein
MKAKLFFAFLLIAGFSINQASAQVKVRHSEKARIAQGVHSGSLTGVEAHRLAKEQRHIRRERHRARKNDGHISKAERRHIRHDKRTASHHIYRYKHNNFSKN